MRLTHGRVQNFRSIVDSGRVEFDDRVTVLVGKNEQGKTSFLRGLASLEATEAYQPKDLPHHLRPALDEKAPAEIPIVSVWLSIDTKDRDHLRHIVGDIDEGAQIRITKSYDGRRQYFLVSNGEAPASERELTVSDPRAEPEVTLLRERAVELKTALKTHAERLPDFAPALEQANQHVDQLTTADFGDHEQIANLIKAFATALKGLPGQDEAIQEAIAIRYR